MRDAVGAWMDAAGRYPLLTAAEELHLGAMVQAWQQWPGGPDAAPAPVRRRGLRARDRMVTANLRLVVAVAKRYQRYAALRAVEFEDLLQADWCASLRTWARSCSGCVRWIWIP